MEVKDDMTEAAKRKMQSDNKKKKKLKKQTYFKEEVMNKPPKKKKLKLIAKPINKINLSKEQEQGIVIGTLKFN